MHEVGPEYMPTGQGPGLKVGETPETGPSAVGRTLQDELQEKGLNSEGSTEGDSDDRATRE